jgi:hypothetical protein
MQPHTVKTQSFTQFERSPESFPKTIVFPEAWDLSEILNGTARPQSPARTEPASGMFTDKGHTDKGHTDKVRNDTTANPV